MKFDMVELLKALRDIEDISIATLGINRECIGDISVETYSITFNGPERCDKKEGL